MTLPTTLPTYNGLNDQQFLNSARIQTIIETAAAYLERTRPLTFLDRLDMVNATDDELFGRFTSRIIAADIIADGQKAAVYEAGSIQLLNHGLPNVKVGQSINQAQINLLSRMQSGLGRAIEEDAAFDWERTFGENLLAGVRERLNMMAASMMMDNFSYNRWGIKLDGASWGMPANLKVTPTVLWSLDGGATPNVNATPITNIFAMDTVDALNYGLGIFDRITMGGATFDFMINSTEFANKVFGLVGAAFIPTSQSIKTASRVEMVELASKLMQKEILIDDKIFRTVNSDGTLNSTRVLPLNKVILDRKQNGRREWDMGNGVVTESIVASMLGGVTMGQNPKMDVGGAYGPVAYYTAATPDLNPPGINGWAVSRSFPRKFINECSAVLTVF
jgi:hypothetical protein